MSSTMEKRGARISGGAARNTHHTKAKSEGSRASLGLATFVKAAPISEESGTCAIFPARPGDHHLACHLLASIQRAPSPTEFQAQLDDPYYEPSDRLLCRTNGALVGHVRLVKREIRFGSTTFPMTNLTDMLVLPEFRRKGCGAALLAAAENEMRADGSLVGIVRTQQPQFYINRGWCVWTRHSYSTAGAREILSQLLESHPEAAVAENGDRPQINIRWWRHIEVSGLIRLYTENTQRAFGPLVRSDAYWQWLLSRRAYDRIYVAIDGPDRFELDEAAAAMVGYAVMKEGRILELMASPNYPQAAELLLARACSDTIEQDGNYVRLDAPVGHPLHHLIARAGGELGYHEAVHGEVCLIKLFDMAQTFEKLGEQLHERAKSAGLSLPLELGLHIDGEKFALEIRPRSVKLRRGRVCRSYLACARSDLTQLLLGHLDLKAAITAGRILASTRIAVELAGALFPHLPLWRPPWDEIPAR